jgi:lipid-A-disaccharide synthase
VQAEFVGHPLAELPQPGISREQFALENLLEPERTWIALLPGSRPKEIRDNLPEMLEAAWILTDRQIENQREFEFLVPLAPTLTSEQRAEVLDLVAELGFGLPVRLVDDARAALFHARASVVASGTATVEAALIGNPFVVVYRVSALTYAIARRVVTVPHVAMANLIAGKRVVAELIQNDFTATNIVQQIEPLLPDGPARESMIMELRAVRTLLATGKPDAGGAIERVASITLDEIRAASPRTA